VPFPDSEAFGRLHKRCSEIVGSTMAAILKFYTAYIIYRDIKTHQLGVTDWLMKVWKMTTGVRQRNRRETQMLSFWGTPL